MTESHHETGDTYEALIAIDHRGHNRHYPKGERFDLDHLEPSLVQRLIDMGRVKFVNEAKKETKHKEK